MECDGAEITAAEAASIMSYRLAYFENSGDASLFLIDRVIFSREGKRIYFVELMLIERLCRRVLFQIFI